jgi:hypothetical protein
MSENNVFWYYMGRVAVHVQIEGESKLISPYSFFLASAGQKFPQRVANLFKRKEPSAEIRQRFEKGGLIAAERKKQIDKETQAADHAKAEAEKARAAARRKGNSAPEKLPLADAVSEEGKKDPKSESKPDEPPKNETRAERKKRIKAEKEAARKAAEEADKTTEEQGDES